ncbi:MAG: hypothetical protein E7359_02950 [Clostridiales bacterium]|nr:hypothetical protein [Clostridiales bacterium]
MEFFKVYEIIVNKNGNSNLSGKMCVGIYKNQEKASYLAHIINVQDCNNTEIIKSQITKQDLLDLHICFKGSDCVEEIITLSKQIIKEEVELIK